MRVAVDTNVLFSAILNPNSFASELLRTLSARHHLLLSTYVLDEIREVIHRKFPGKMADIDRMLLTIPHEIIYSPEVANMEEFSIRAPDDYMVLYSAILGEADILVTGDKDFQELQLKQIAIYTPREFFNRYLC